MEVLDDKKRVILSISGDGQFAIARFEDMTEKDKNFLIEVYSDLAGSDDETIEKVKRFLNFEDDEGVFCS
jgi:hypothetical protein